MTAPAIEPLTERRASGKFSYEQLERPADRPLKNLIGLLRGRRAR